MEPGLRHMRISHFALAPEGLPSEFVSSRRDRILPEDLKAKKIYITSTLVDLTDILDIVSDKLPFQCEERRELRISLALILFLNSYDESLLN